MASAKKFNIYSLFVNFKAQLQAVLTGDYFHSAEARSSQMKLKSQQKSRLCDGFYSLKFLKKQRSLFHYAFAVKPNIRNIIQLH